MIHYELHNRTKFFLSQEHKLASKKPARVVLDSIFWGVPSNHEIPVEKSIVLDTNMFNFIRQNPQGEAANFIVDVSRKTGLLLDPSFALIEQRLRHANPEAALREYKKSLENNFHVYINEQQIDFINWRLNSNLKALQFNVELLRDYLPLIKKLWRSKSTPLEKIKKLSEEIISRDLPRFTFAFLFGAVAFLTKVQNLKITNEERSKIQSDMAISPNQDEEQNRLFNVAFDMALFAFCIEAAVPKEEEKLFLSKLASADASSPVFCRNIKCLLLTRINPPKPSKPMAIGSFSLVPDVDFDKKTVDEVMSLVPQGRGPETAEIRATRRENLSAFAKQISGL